ncbi:AraC family transcriptional regulator [Flavobacterium aquidurense]|uniref:AraC family transcriptional regulator n=1 Tax=Flavobacterium aquidurense TaxID=362413 RepID=UPI003714EB2D
MTDQFSQGISIEKFSIKKSDFNAIQLYDQATRSHRDEAHTFHILEKGSIVIEIDFQQYEILAPSVVYMHPNQVHRILDFSNVTVCSLALKNENLNPTYLDFLEEIVPVKPLALTKDTYINISDTFSLCLKFSTLKNNKLYHLLLKDSCNALLVLIVSTFLNQNKYSDKLSRAGLITKYFKQLLEKNYHTIKRPTQYAKSLNISTHYLNESVKYSTGSSVSQHIKDRIILEAKRLLYHTDKSVKEISFELGYEDYPYFSRLFSKTAGMSAITFRNKRHD